MGPGSGTALDHHRLGRRPGCPPGRSDPRWPARGSDRARAPPARPGKPCAGRGAEAWERARAGARGRGDTSIGGQLSVPQLQLSWSGARAILTTDWGHWAIARTPVSQLPAGPARPRRRRRRWTHRKGRDARGAQWGPAARQALRQSTPGWHKSACGGGCPSLRGGMRSGASKPRAPAGVRPRPAPLAVPSRSGKEDPSTPAESESFKLQARPPGGQSSLQRRPSRQRPQSTRMRRCRPRPGRPAWEIGPSRARARPGID